MSDEGETCVDGGELTEVADGDRVTTMIVVGELASPLFLASLSSFVRCAKRFRELASTERLRPQALAKLSPDGATALEEENGDTDPGKEFAGKKKYSTKNEVEANCRHGFVVNEMLRLLLAEGLRAGRDVNRDVFVLAANAVSHLFEVKTVCDSTSLYQLVGQLYWNSAGEPAPRRVAVLPAPLNSDQASKLRGLDIELVTYEWRGVKPEFSGLFELFSRPKRSHGK